MLRTKLSLFHSPISNGLIFNNLKKENFSHVIIITCSVLTPYYTEEVLFSLKDLEVPNEDGVSILFYLQKIFPGLVSFKSQLLC